MTPRHSSRPGGRTGTAQAASNQHPKRRTETGPLRSTRELPLTLAFASEVQTAPWVAFVALRGHFAYVAGAGWYRYDGAQWLPTDGATVRVCLRRALGEWHDHLIESEGWSNHGIVVRLLDLNRAFRVAERMRPVVTVSAERLGVEG